MKKIHLHSTSYIRAITSDRCNRVTNFAGNVANNQHPTTKSRKRAKWHLVSLVLILVMMLGFIRQGFAQTVVTNPSNPWIVPAGVTSVKVEVWGSGGGGGGTIGGNGGGGGGGAYHRGILTVSPGQSYTITIGAAGAINSGNGNPSTVSGPGGTVTANGGIGGVGTFFSNGAGGAGGTGGTFSGGTGGTSTGNGAGGGGGAGNSTAGVAGANASTGAGGAGNPNVTPYIGGNGGAFRTNNGVGNNGNIPGGGGGGGKGTNNGGLGGAGQIVLTYTVCTPPAAPLVTTPVNYCINAVAIPLTATGSNLLWYTVPTNGTGSSTAPTPITTAVGTTPYYVSQTVGCEGPRAQINVIVNAPVATVTGQTPISCYGANDATITVAASGGVSPYTFTVEEPNWLPQTTTNVHLFKDLLPNHPYRVRVKDHNGCISK